MELTELKGTGAVEVTDPAVIAKAMRYNALKTAEDALTKERKAVAKELAEDFLSLGHEQMLLNGEPILSADVSYSQTYDYEYLAKRAPKAFERATKPRSYFIRLTRSNKVR